MYIYLSIYFSRLPRAHLDDPRQQAMHAMVHGGVDQVCDTISIYIQLSIYICMSIYLSIYCTRSLRAHLDDPRQQAMYAVVHGGIDHVCAYLCIYLYV